MQTRLTTRSLVLLVALTALMAAAPGAARAQSWTKLKKLANPTGSTLSDFGVSVAVSCDTAVVGARNAHGAKAGSGAAFVHERHEGGPNKWGRVATLIASNGAASDEFGAAVAVVGDTVFIGAPDADSPTLAGTGSVYVYQRNQGGPSAWGEVLQLASSTGEVGSRFGSAVAARGDTLVVGAARQDHQGTTDVGAAYVFERDLGGPGAWGETRELGPSNPVLSGRFGSSAAIDGDTLVVGSPTNTWGNPLESAYVFERDLGGPGTWGESAALTESHDLGRFGFSVSISNDRIAVGAPGHTHTNAGQGAVFLFERDAGGPGAWGEVAELLATAPANGDQLGYSVAVHGETVVVGAPTDNHNGGPNKGSVRVFERSSGGSGAWSETQVVIENLHGPLNQFGRSVALDRNTFVVSTIDNGPNAGQAYAYGRAAPAPSIYCTAGTTTNGCTPYIVAAGGVSQTLPSGFQITVWEVEGQKQGLLYFGTTGPKITPWGAGTSYRCVQGPHTRTAPQGSGGTAGGCDGQFQLDFNTWMAANPQKAPAEGDGVWMQAWFRDPWAPLTTNFSNALHFTLCP
jgi:hypothetical protein